MINSNDSRCEDIKDKFMNVYERGLEYLRNWMSSLEEFKIFKWMKLNDKPTWDQIKITIVYLRKKNVQIDDSLLFDQFSTLNTFMENVDMEFKNKLSSVKWIDYFKKVNASLSSEFLKICSFIFAIPSHICECGKSV